MKVSSVFPAWETADFKGRQPITQGLAQVKFRFGPDSAMYGASLIAQVVKYLPAMQETQVQPWVRKIPWRTEWQPTPVFLPGKSHGQRSLGGYSPWGHKESDTTEQAHMYTKTGLVRSKSRELEKERSSTGSEEKCPLLWGVCTVTS